MYIFYIQGNLVMTVNHVRNKTHIFLLMKCLMNVHVRIMIETQVMYDQGY